METEHAYMAGIIDGEGTIWPSRPPRSRSRHIAVVNTDWGLIEWIQQRYGGSIIELRPQNLSRKVQWRLTWQSKATIVALLDAIEPYLVVKRHLAEAMRVDIAAAPGVGRPGVKRKDTCVRGHDTSKLLAGRPCPGCQKFWNDEIQRRKVAARK